MALGVNQTYKNYYTVRLNSLTTQHQIQSNRMTLFTNEITDIASKINFFESQKVLTLATPDGSNLAIGAKYFDLPAGFDPADQDTWTGNHPYYTTPCQKQLFIYKKIDATEAGNYTSGTATDYYFAGNLQNIGTASNPEYYAKVPYSKTGTDYNGGTSLTGGHPAAAIMNADAAAITDARVLSNRLMTGEFIFMYTNDNNQTSKVGYKDLTFILESQDKTAYQEVVQNLEAERENINDMQKSVQEEMQTTEVQIQAIQSLMESTEKVLQKNTEKFKWGA